MPKAKKMTNLLELEGGNERDKKNIGEEKPIKAGKARRSRTQRFLARLQRCWATLTCCIRGRNNSNQEKTPSNDVPEPNYIASWENEKVNVTSDREEDCKDQTLKTNGQERPMTADVEQQVPQHDHQVQVQIHSPETVCIQSNSGLEEEKLTTSYVEQQILQHYLEVQAQILSYEDIYIQYYSGLEKEKEKLPTSYVEQQVHQEDYQVQDQIHSPETVYTQTSGLEKENLTTSYVEEQIFKHYLKEQAQILSYEDVYFQYYSGLEKDKLMTKDVEEQALQHHPEVQAQILNHEAINMQCNSGQKIEEDAVEQIEDRKENGTPKISESLIPYHEEKSVACLEEAAAITTPKKKTVPLTLKSFHFHTLLGRGGYGKVTSATDIIRQEHVAIKIVNKSTYTEEGCSLVERDILCLSHENDFLVHGLAAFQTKNYIYYVMELATGGSLYDLHKKHCPCLDVPTLRFVTAEVICGLQFLHQKGIIHRDVKPHNIVLTREGHIKLADFGICIMNVHGHTTDKCGGTREFAAPEMVNSKPYGAGVDFFALGVSLYLMCTGEYPFSGRNREELRIAITTKTPQYPELLAPETIDILKGLLNKDQDMRLGVNGKIREHPFFSTVNWNNIENKRAVPPEMLKSVPVDIDLSTNRRHREEPSPYPIKSQKLFRDFSFVSPMWSQDYHSTNVVQITDWVANLFSKRPSRK